MHFTYTDKDILDGRFEFRQSGSFRVLSPYIILKIIAACVAEVFIALLVLCSFDDIVIADIYKSAISYIIIRIALSIILPILPIWYILFIIGGEEQYRYTADSRTMRIASKRHTYIFKYTDVESVTYKPMKLFTKQKGFTVKITTKNNEVIFRYIMPANAEFFTIQSTPFYILQHPPIKAEERKDR